MNCLTVSLLVWAARGFRGRIGIIAGGNPFPHFAVVEGGTATHYKALDSGLPWYRQFHFDGVLVDDHVGEP